MSLLEELTGWASALRYDDVPPRVLDVAKTQILSQLAAIRAGLTHAQGRMLVQAFGPPLQADPKQSAMVMAGLGSWLHFDDTAYAGHLSNSTVAVPLAYTRALGRDGRALLTAVVAANECAARLTAAATLGPFRGQMAAHTNLMGAVSGRLHCEGAPARCWTDAAALALAMPPWNLMHGFMGSDARILGSALPVRTALDACDAATAGLTGAADILEHRKGFLSRFATVPLLEAVTAGLGKRWHTETLSFKVRPSGPGADTAVDCAVELHHVLGRAQAEQVAEVVVRLSIYTLLVEREIAAYMDGPDTRLSALVSSTPYAVATALLTGDLQPEDFAEPAVRSADRWRLASRVRLVHDESMTAALLASHAPFGEALRQAGGRAADWLQGFGSSSGTDLVALLDTLPPPSDSFAAAVKATPAAVRVRLANGTAYERRADVPVGGAGWQTRAAHRQLMRAKFVGGGGDEEDADAVLGLDRLTPAETKRLIESALRGQPR